MLKSNGPMLLAVNHPNSFLDAIILVTQFKQPVYSLARGDAFNGWLLTKILTGFKILPVYRVTEGVENLEGNYKTFEDCTEIFRQNGIVLIFTEGRCENEWHLRPLRKGTARLAIAAWEQNIPLKILPVGMNYNSFSLFGKNLQINMGTPIEVKDIDASFNDSGRLLNEVTGAIQKQLQTLVYELDKKDLQLRAAKFNVPVSTIKKLLLIIPAILGILFHWIFYVPVKNFIAKKTLNTGHYDSVIVGLMILFYPFYLLLWSLIIYSYYGGYWGWLVFIILPFFAWSYVQIKRQADT
jgi:1-acyl-sn-glycerol-3-phosphate acyltransferase